MDEKFLHGAIAGFIAGILLLEYTKGGNNGHQHKHHQHGMKPKSCGCGCNGAGKCGERRPQPAARSKCMQREAVNELPMFIRPEPLEEPSFAPCGLMASKGFDMKLFPFPLN